VRGQPSSQDARELVQGRYGLVFIVILVIATAARVPGLFSEFWLDEIWTLRIADGLHSPLDILTSVQDSNNHHLNTLFFYLLGHQEHWFVYRLHSLVAGVGIVAFAWLIAARFGALEKLLAAGLTAVSYLAIHFSSEARGYAMAVFFAFATLWAALRFADRRDVGSAALIWMSACLGWLSHLSYVDAFAALVVWLPIRLWKACDSRREALWRSVLALGVPVTFAGAFYLFDIRRMTIQGAPDYRLSEVLTKAASYTGGGPGRGALTVAVALLAVLILAAGIGAIARRRDDSWIFYALVIFFVPATVLAVLRPEVLFVRYFLVSIGFGLVAAALFLADLLRSGAAGRAAAAMLIAGFVIGNALNTARFYRYGRGGYLEALRHIAMTSPGPVATLGGDLDFRNAMVVDFYQRYLPPGKTVDYVTHEQYPPEGPEWVVLHRIGSLGDVYPSIDDSLGNTFLLDLVEPYSDLSGWYWLVYRRKGP
jgi:hypothetical protein